MHLFFAVYEEHKARTGHDIYRGTGRIFGPANCAVCLHLNVVKIEREKAEAEAIERERLEAEMGNGRIET